MDHLAKCPNCLLTFSANMPSCPYCARVFCHCTNCGSKDFVKTEKENVYHCQTCGQDFTYKQS